MKRETYMFGVRGEQYGIWNAQRKCWQFGICEDTPMLAEARLFQRIGDDARKWRFEARILPKEMRKAVPPEPQLVIELQRKDRELKLLKHSLREGGVKMSIAALHEQCIGWDCCENCPIRDAIHCDPLNGELREVPRNWEVGK